MTITAEQIYAARDALHDSADTDTEMQQHMADVLDLDPETLALVAGNFAQAVLMDAMMMLMRKDDPTEGLLHLIATNFTMGFTVARQVQHMQAQEA